MMPGGPLAWDPRKEKAIRETLAELKALEEGGFFDGLEPSTPAASRVAPAVTAKEETRGRLVAKKLSQLKLLDQPWGPALSQFMSQVSVRDRTEEYKEDNRRRFEEATAQVRILFGKITRREVASSALIRAVVGSFMDTFMKDRNLLLNLAAHSGSNRDYLYDHSLKLCLISLSIASASGYSRAQAVDIAQGALLADIGMLLVPEAIRLKRGKLTQGEILEMQKHPLLGLTLLEPIHNLSEAILLIPWQHHERLSGTGYPEKRAGAAVSRYSRIVGIADIFTALINKRSWREAQVPYDAMVAILGMGGQGLLDGEHIRGFLRTLSIFPLGSLVRLSTGCVAKVVAPNPVEFTKPLVSVLTAPGGTSLPREKIHQVDLARDTGTTIVEALPEKAISHSILDGF